MSTTRGVRAYPWGSLDATTQADVAALAGMRRWGEAHARLDTLAAALSALIETPVRVVLRRASSRAAAGALDDGVAALLTSADAPFDLESAILLEAEGGLAASLVARALRRRAPAIQDRSRIATFGLGGAFASIVAATARRANAGNALRVVAAGPSAALVDNLARMSGEVTVVSFTVLVGDEAFLARALLRRDAAGRAPHRPWNRASLLALDGLLMAIPIVACSGTCPAAEIKALRRGDAWMPGAWRLERTKDGGLAGDVTLAGPEAERGMAARLEMLGEGASLVVGGNVNELGWTEEAKVAGSQDTTNALIDSLGEVPVVVRVEIGAAQMPARLWAELGVGDVVALGRRVADPVLLRVGGVEVARGELVDIEGEVGVRILERVDATVTGDRERVTSA